MFFIPLILVAIIAIILQLKYNPNWWYTIVTIGVSVLITFGIVGTDIMTKTTDTEVWSGKIINWEHKEEYDELKTETYTDSKGKTKTKTKWVHHNATNKVKTTDNGWIIVRESPDGKKMNDSWPNTTEELKEMWPKNTPTASTHTYTNKVQASYSVFKHENIDPKEYPDLPEYPKEVRDYFYIDRIIGNVPNKDEALKVLNQVNTELNKSVPDPKKPGKTKSYKQVNLIFVNVGENKPQEYGFALQDKWEGGNKNDFVVSFSMNSDGVINWVYPFTWSEVEILKLEVRDYFLNKGKINDFVLVINDVSKMVEDKFIRKQFAEFDYLQIEISFISNIIIWLLNIALLITYTYIILSERSHNHRNRNRFNLNRRSSRF